MVEGGGVFCAIKYSHSGECCWLREKMFNHGAKEESQVSQRRKIGKLSNVTCTYYNNNYIIIYNERNVSMTQFEFE